MAATRKFVGIAIFVNLMFGSLLAHSEVHIEAKYKGRLVVGAWEHPWTEVLDEGLNASTLLAHEEKQIEKMCPGYTKFADKRRLFWQQLLISLSWRESLHGPENWVEFNGGTNNGLYQINPVLRRAYDCEGYVLFDPHQNITCAVKMAQKLVTRFGSFLVGKKGGMAAYWQPLRATNAYNRKNRKFILDHVTKACRTGELAYHQLAEFVPEGGFPDVDRSFNTIDDLGLTPEELGDANDVSGMNYLQPNFEVIW